MWPASWGFMRRMALAAAVDLGFYGSMRSRQKKTYPVNDPAVASPTYVAYI